MSAKATDVVKASNLTAAGITKSEQEHDSAKQLSLNSSTKPPKKNYYVPNMLRTLQENIDEIETLKKEISIATQKLDPKIHQGLLTRNKLNHENFSKFTVAYHELVAALKSKEDDKNSVGKLSGLVDEVFELHRQFYILNLDIRALKVEEYFKIDKNIKISQEILREVYHTIQLCIPDFNEYFKYKNKTAAGGTDNRTAIKWLSIKEETVAEAIEALFENPDFVNTKLGKEKILVAEFPNLSEKGAFNSLSGHISHDCNEALMRHIFLHDKKCIIFFLKDFQAKRMDLHGCDSKMAVEHAQINIRNLFLQFDDVAILMTGRGKHNASGKSANQIKLLKQLDLWKRSDKHFIQSFHISPDGGSIKIKFRPAKSINFTNLSAELTQAIQNQEHRIIVKLDKKYPMSALEQIAIKLTLLALQTNADLGVGSLFPKQSEIECDNVKLFFTYPNVNIKLFEYNSDFDSLSHTSWPAITMAVSPQEPGNTAAAERKHTAVISTAAATASAGTATTKITEPIDAAANSMLHLKKANGNQASAKHKVSNQQPTTNIKMK